MTTLSSILKAAGFTGAGLATAEGVVHVESGANALAHNPNAATGDNSYGIFQINMLGSMGPARLKAYGLASNAALFDPLTNAKVAFKMSNGGTKWTDWTSWTSGLFQSFVGKDQTITYHGMAGDPPAPAGSSTTIPAPLAGTTTAPAFLDVPSIPSASDIGAAITKALTYAVVVAGGAGLVILGVNKAAGNPAGKAGKAAAPVAAAAAL